MIVEAIAEESFAKEAPKDSNYKVEGVEVYLVTGTNERVQVK